MSELMCEREYELLEAFAAGGLDHSQEQHLAACPNCRSAIEAAGLMKILAGSVGEAPSPVAPSAAAIWKMAELVREQRLRKRFKWIQVGLGTGALLVSILISVVVRTVGGSAGTVKDALSSVFDLRGQSTISPVLVFVVVLLAVALFLRVVNLSSRASDSV
jgi:predicted anti-sigma-YlaC factor YlaD